MNSDRKYIPTIFFEVIEILPKDKIPINDSFTLSIRLYKKCLTELFPIHNILSFQIEDQTKSAIFSVKINKGPLTVFSGEVEISRLVFLNKEQTINRCISLTPIQNNKKLIVALSDVSSVKISFKIKIAYNEMQMLNIVTSNRNYKGIIPMKSRSKSKQNTGKSQANNKKFNNQNFNLRTAEDHHVPRDTLINIDDLKFIGQKDGEETSDYDNLLNDSVDQAKNYEYKGEQEKFSNLMSELTNAIANFENLPCTKFSKAIGEKFFKIQSNYFNHFEEYSNKYHRVKKLMNKYNEKYRLYNKMLNKLKKSIRENDNQHHFQAYVSKMEISSVSKQREIMQKQLDLFKVLTRVDEKEQEEKQDGSSNDFIVSSERRIIKDTLESLNKKPELMTKIPEKLFELLKEHSVAFGVKLEIPSEWRMDKIEEVPEASILSSDK